MFKKRYEDEKRDIPEILKLFILVVVIGLMFIGINVFCNYMDRVDMEMQYSPDQIEQVM